MCVYIYIFNGKKKKKKKEIMADIKKEKKKKKEEKEADPMWVKRSQSTKHLVVIII